MSATIASTPAHQGLILRSPEGRAAPKQVSEGTYRRRRVVVGTVLAAFVASSLVLAHDVLVGSGGVPASAAASQPAPVRRSITALPGDTLWSIAQTYRGDVPVSRYVDKLVSLNDGASIQAGQTVVIP